MKTPHSKREGLILVEGLLVCSVLIGLLGMLTFIHAAATARVHTFQKARADAWSKAMAGCPSPDLNVGDVVQGIADGTVPLPDAFQPSDEAATASASETLTSVAGKLLTMHSEVSIPCQSKPPVVDGDAEDWVEKLFAN